MSASSSHEFPFGRTTREESRGKHHRDLGCLRSGVAWVTKTTPREPTEEICARYSSNCPGREVVDLQRLEHLARRHEAAFAAHQDEHSLTSSRLVGIEAR
jgi:hypothetical protein